MSSVKFIRGQFNNDQIIESSNKYYVQIYCDDAFEKKFKLTGINRYYFVDSEYANIKQKDDPKGWACMVNPVNMFFECTSDEDLAAIVSSMDEMTYYIRQGLVGVFDDSFHKTMNLINFSKSLGETLYNLVVKIDLLNKIRRFIDEKLYVGNFENVGSNPQDKSDITYFEDDTKRLVTLSVLTKMLFPIFGLYLSILKEIKKKNKNTDISEIIENNLMYCSIILDKVLESFMQIERDKLCDYVSYFTKNIYNDYDLLPKTSSDNYTKKSDISNYTSVAFANINTESLIDNVLSHVLIKALVNGNIISAPGSDQTIMSYIHKTIKATVNAKLQSANKKGDNIYRRIDPTRGPDDVVSQFDIDSVPSDTSMKIIGMIDNNISKVIGDSLDVLDDSDIWDHYDKLLAFYKHHPIVPSHLNKLCLCTYFGPDLGGGESILHNDYFRYTQMLAAFQLYCWKMNLHELMHLLSAKPGNKKIKELNYQSYTSVVTEACRQKYKYCPELLDKSINILTDDVTTRDYIYNTADRLWTLIGVENINGSLIIPTLSYFEGVIHVLQR